METIKFQKYHGIGNDFIIIDCLNNSVSNKFIEPNLNLFKRICSRNFGIGADGIIFVMPSNDNSDFRMRIFNSDGSEPEMCGNGIRCLVKYLLDSETYKSLNSYRIETLAGSIVVEVDNEANIVVNMGIPTFEKSLIPTLMTESINNVPTAKIEIENNLVDVYSAGMGNPHAVILLEELKNFSVSELGSRIEHHHLFPQKTNVHFVNIINLDSINILVWERGAGETLACGTGACATVAVLSKLGYVNENVIVNLPGGSLNINWPNLSGSIFMSGPAEHVFSGSFDI